MAQLCSLPAREVGIMARLLSLPARGGTATRGCSPLFPPRSGLFPPRSGRGDHEVVGGAVSSGSPCWRVSSLLCCATSFPVQISPLFCRVMRLSAQVSALFCRVMRLPVLVSALFCRVTCLPVQISAFLCRITHFSVQVGAFLLETIGSASYVCDLRDDTRSLPPQKNALLCIGAYLSLRVFYLPDYASHYLRGEYEDTTSH